MEEPTFSVRTFQDEIFECRTFHSSVSWIECQFKHRQAQFANAVPLLAIHYVVNGDLEQNCAGGAVTRLGRKHDTRDDSVETVRFDRNL